ASVLGPDVEGRGGRASPALGRRGGVYPSRYGLERRRLSRAASGSAAVVGPSGTRAASPASISIGLGALASRPPVGNATSGRDTGGRPARSRTMAGSALAGGGPAGGRRRRTQQLSGSQRVAPCATPWL